MKKSELIEGIDLYDSSIGKNNILRVLDALSPVICQELYDNGEVTLPGLIKLSVSQRAEREGRHPQTGEKLIIPAKRVPKMKALKALKEGIA